MSRTVNSARHAALAADLRRRREQAGLTQAQLAQRMHRYQSFVTDYERGKKRIDVVLLVEIAEALGFDPADAVATVRRTRKY